MPVMMRCWYCGQREPRCGCCWRCVVCCPCAFDCYRSPCRHLHCWSARGPACVPAAWLGEPAHERGCAPRRIELELQVEVVTIAAANVRLRLEGSLHILPEAFKGTVRRPHEPAPRVDSVQVEECNDTPLANCSPILCRVPVCVKKPQSSSEHVQADNLEANPALLWHQALSWRWWSCPATVAIGLH